MTSSSKLSHLVFALGLVCGLAACGGSADSGSDSAPGGGNVTTVIPGTPGALARLEVSPAAITFTARGAKQAITVRGFDAAGHELPAPAAVFKSSNVAFAGVGNDGAVQSNTDVGSTIIDVRVGDIVAAPVTVLGLHPADGVILVGDAQIVAKPVAGTDRSHALVTLSGVPALTPGALVLGTGATPLGGRVVSATASATGTTVELVDVPITTLVKDMSVNFEFSPEQVNAASQLDPAVLRANGARARAMSVRPLSTRIGGFSCETSADFSIINGEFEGTLNTPNVSFIVQHEITASRKTLTTVVARGTMSASLKGVFRIGGTLDTGVSCSAPLARLVAPVFGAASLIVAPTLPLNAEFDLASQVSYAGFSFGVNDTLTATADVGFQYTEDGTQAHQQFDTSNQLQPVATFPVDQGPRAKVTAFGGLTSGLNLGFGNLGTTSLFELQLLKVSAGPEFEGRVAGPYTGAVDPTFDTGYDLKIKVEFAPGADIEAALEHLLVPAATLHISNKIEDSLGKSPAATSMVVDKSTFAAGDTLKFSIDFAPEQTRFPVVGYNIGEVRIYRLDYTTQSIAQVASAAAAPDQTHFDIAWTADAAGEASDTAGRPVFFAFVVDVPLAALSRVLPFELGPIQTSVDGAQRLAGTGTSSMALADDGTIHVRGTNNGGALGTGTLIAVGARSDGDVVTSLANVKAISGNAWFGVALIGDGSVYAWGWGLPIGNPSSPNNPTPFAVDSGLGSRNIAISSGYDHSLVLRKDGSVYGFGVANNGVLGPNTPSFHDTGMGPAKAIAAGGSVSVVVRPDGTVWTMGRGIEGQLGNGTFADSAVPVQVSGLADVTAVAAGNLFAMALKRDGTVWAWGYNAHGELGNGTTLNSAVPVRVGTLVGVAKISAGEYHGMALADGVVYTWGLGQYGRLGTGDQSNRSAPTSVLTGAVDIDGGEFHSMAALKSGVVMAWGYNSLGQGSANTVFFPVLLTPTDTFLRVGAR